MIELIYPAGLAPIVPPPSVGDAGTPRRKSEMFPVIEPNGMVTGRAERAYCHSGAKPLHPVVHIQILNRFGQLYLQKRSMHKDIQPGKWDTAVGGHVSYGESVLEAVFREAYEELGFMDFNPIGVKSYVFESEIEKELVNVFAAVGNFDLHPDHDEVDEGRWWDFSEIESNIGKGIFTPNFENEFCEIRNILSALL